MTNQTILANPVERSEHTTAKIRSDVFFILLLLIALAGFAARLYIVSERYMAWDEWEHVFIASGARGIDVRFELKIDAHPPLHIELLRILMHFGHSKLLYRSISILSGGGIIFLLGLIARRICSYPAVALLCACAFAFSEVALAVGVEVRSYELTVFLVMLAFSYYLDLLPSGDMRPKLRSYLLFSVATALAASCHYFAGLFLGACFLAAPFLPTGANEVRGRIGRLVKMTGALFFPLCVIAYFYVKHASKQPIQGYLAQFYWNRDVHESRFSFLLRNSKNFWNLFSPVSITSEIAFLVTAAVLLSIAVGLLFAAPDSRGRARALRMTAIAFPALMIIELMVLSSASAYPYGGLVRHQYIVQPFLILAAFILLDRAVTLLKPRLRVAVLSVTAAAIAVNSALPRPTLIEFPGQVMYSSEFASYRSEFPNARAVYLDRFGSIAYFSQTDHEQRHFVKSIHDIVLIDWYHINGGSPQGTEIFYDKYRGSLDLSDEKVYHSFASVLQQSGLKELTLFYFRPGNRNFEEPAKTVEQMIIDKAASQGLVATKVVVNGYTVSAGFKLAKE